MAVFHNKSTLIDLLCKELIKHKDDFPQHPLVIDGSLSVPVELYEELTINSLDLDNTMKESDTIIIYQLPNINPQSTIAVTDDTDILVFSAMSILSPHEDPFTCVYGVWCNQISI